MLSAIRFIPRDESLIPWIKYIWYFKKENAKICYKLLPTDCIDLIINLSNDIIYETNSKKTIAPNIHINGLRDKYSYIYQTGNICIFGISFYSFGLYPFVNKPLWCIHDKIIDLNSLSVLLEQKLKLVVNETITSNKIDLVEKVLLSELKVKHDYIYKATIMRDFIESSEKITIHSFCSEHGINIRTFERMFLQYTAYEPKLLQRIKRFQIASNQLVHQNPEKLTDVVYDNGFTDQSHLIKEFHRFSGKSPIPFLREKSTIKENIKYSYL